MRRNFAVTALAAAFSLTGFAAQGQTIYPIDRAEILTGARFDFKVEFPGLVDEKDIAITINGEDYGKALGGTAQFVAREDDKDQSAVILRDVSLTRAGRYAVRVAA